ncbi:MAG: hypothetical protein JO360_12555, partial [Acidobacteria bacterium]|nr:hypothetical protein [Acidobacteriota bacterium]
MRTLPRFIFGLSKPFAVSLLATLLWCAGLPHRALAADVILDYRFGTSGTVIKPLESIGRDMALQADGKIVVVGERAFPNGGFVLARYNPDGSLDPTFGTGGIPGVVVTIFPNQSQYSGANTLLIQPDGKILAGGYVRTTPTTDGYDFGLARYNPNGTLDTSFGTGGTVTTDFATKSDQMLDMALQPDGKIVCVGSAYYVNQQQQYELAMVRYNSNGTVDTGFGTAGKVNSNTTWGERATSIVLRPDGKIWVGGQIINLNTIWDMAVARYNSDGSVDASFGTGGLISFDRGTSDDGVKDLLLQPDGKLVVTGVGAHLVIVRLNEDGTPDPTFIGPPANENLSPEDIKLQADGKFLVGVTINSDFGLLRLNSDGTLDTTFDGDGRASANLGGFNPTTDNVAAIAIQPDGKIVVAGASGGYISGSSFIGFALVRFQTTARPPAVPYDFDGDGKADLGVFRPSNGSWYVRQSSNGALSGFKWGAAGDLPEPADFDGDSRNDFVIFRNGAWYIVNSFDSTIRGAQFGTTGD